MTQTHASPYVARWRPAPIWLAAGLFLGPACGAAFGIALLLPGSGDSFVTAMIFGGLWGGSFGAFIGMIVGFIMTFAVGSHLTDQQAGERAFLFAFWATGLFTFPMLLPLAVHHPVGIVGGFFLPLGAGLLTYRLTPLLR